MSVKLKGATALLLNFVQAPGKNGSAYFDVRINGWMNKLQRLSLRILLSHSNVWGKPKYPTFM
jgi:hypothetical protein